MMLLSGCANTVYKTEVEVYCPTIKIYPEDFNNRLADEIEDLPADSQAISEAISNYIVLRDKVRACEKQADTLKRKQNNE
jgi:hypothetical protein